jgi:hypothetical protein
MEIKVTIFKVPWDRETKKFKAGSVISPGPNWRMVNFQPILGPEPMQNHFVAVWEKDENEDENN